MKKQEKSLVKCRRIVANRGGVSSAHPYSNNENYCIRIVTTCNQIKYTFHKVKLNGDCFGSSGTSGVGDRIQLKYGRIRTNICTNQTGDIILPSPGNGI